MNGPASRELSTGAGDPSLAGRDAVFAQELMQDGTTRSADPAGPPAGAAYAQGPADYGTMLALASRSGAGTGPSATDPWEIAFADADLASASTMDSFFAGPGDNVAANV
jgi:hypothetical protein